jgi:diadenylate cyclase
LGAIDNVIECFKDLVNLSSTDEEALMKVEGIGEKRAKSIIKGIQLMRNRSAYH